MKIRLIVIWLCLAGLVFASCDSRKVKIKKQIDELYSNVLDIPYCDMDTLLIDPLIFSNDAKYNLLVYVDSSECTPCYASHHQEWEYTLNECKKYNPSITLTIIIESSIITDEIKEIFLRSNFPKSIFIDKTGIFRKKNPTFPNANNMHVLLLDKDNKVLLVGNPLNNKKIEELLYKKLRES